MDILICFALGTVLGGLLGILGHQLLKKKYHQLVNIFTGVIILTLGLTLYKSPFKLSIVALFDRGYYVTQFMQNKLGGISLTDAQKGIKHLDLEALLKWNDFRIRLAERHRSYCSNILTGPYSEITHVNALTEFYDKELHDYAEILIKASRKISAESSFEIDINEYQEGIKEIMFNLEEAEQERFALSLSSSNLEEEGRCLTSLTLMKGIKSLSDKRKLVMLRALAIH